MSGTVVGIDLSPIFIARGQELARDIPNLTFVEGDARALPLEDGSVDIIMFHTTLCHVPSPELALTEAARVPDVGRLASPSSTAITRRPPARAATSTRSRHARMPR